MSRYLGLVFATSFCESCATVGAALTVGAWRGNVETDGLSSDCCSEPLLSAAVWLLGERGSRMDGKWAGGIAAASTVLLWVIAMYAKGAFL
jgi:hypothetical protein